MYEDIRRNKIKTGFIVSLFLIMLSFIVYYICYYFELGYFSIVIALVFSIGTTWASYYYSDTIVLKLNKARPATDSEYQKLNNILDALVISSGLGSRPKLYVVDDEQPNAFATGRNPENSVICVTSGLLETLDYYELEAVVAHELSHIKNYDILLSAIVTVMVGLIINIADFFTRTTLFGKSRDNDNNSGNIVFLIIGLIFLIISPIFAQLMKLALSRRREYLADATAVQFTRNPDGLISALEKISQDTHQLKNASTSTAHMFFSNPFKKKAKNLWSTHPAIEDRIKAIKELN